MIARIIITGKLIKGIEPRVFENAVRQVNRIIADYTGSVFEDELIRDSEDPFSYMMISKWTSKEAWDRWRAMPIHAAQLHPLRQYWQMQTIKAYEIAFVDERSPLLS